MDLKSKTNPQILLRAPCWLLSVQALPPPLCSPTAARWATSPSQPIKLIPASGPLHVLFTLPGMLFLWLFPLNSCANRTSEKREGCWQEVAEEGRGLGRAWWVWSYSPGNHMTHKALGWLGWHHLLLDHEVGVQHVNGQLHKHRACRTGALLSLPCHHRPQAFRA